LSGEPIVKTLVLAGLCLFASFRCYAETDITSINWKLLFNQLFAQEIKKETAASNAPFTSFQAKLREHTAWTPLAFDEVIAEVMQAETSTEAYNIRTEIYDSPENYQQIATLDFNQSIPYEIQSLPRLDEYLNQITESKDNAVNVDSNFFESHSGQQMMSAISWQHQSTQPRPVSLVIVPGYAGHLIKVPIFEDITHDANQYYGRDNERPIIFESSLGFEVEDYRTFYANNMKAANHFDIIAPAGLAELGNTAGSNLESTELLTNWLQNLPQEYQNHDFILFGYSKGAPVILDVLRHDPSLKNRIKGLVTYGGVIQGTNIARTGVDAIDDFVGNLTLAEFVDRLQEKDTDEVLRIISPLFGKLPFSPYKFSVLTEVFDIFDFDIRETENAIDELLTRRELPELRDGIVDLLPIERVRWNLLHLNNNIFAPNTFIFNLSAITDIATFSAPGGITENGQKNVASISPILNDEGELIWKDFSLDAVFLYLSSLEGFKLAPGGLYDTQVELGNSKIPLIDPRPYQDSLTPSEIDTLWDEPAIKQKLQSNNISSIQQFATTPRDLLIHHGETNNIHAADLGEIKGHHWSIMRQAFRAPIEISADHASWSFPRKAYMRALLQLMAIHNIVKEYDMEVK
jgi:hypothetical protein